MTIDAPKFEEMMTLMSKLLPVEDDHREAIDAIFGQGFTNEIPQFMFSFAKAMLHYPEELDGWLEWIIQAIAYSRNERQDYPVMEGVTVDKIQKLVRIEISKMSNPEKIKAIKKLESEESGTYSG